MGKVLAMLVAGAILVGAGVLLGVGPQSLRVFAPPSFAESGGTRVTLEVDPATAELVTAVLERRLANMDWHGASVRRDGEQRIVVEVPGVSDKDMVARIVGTRGALAFRLVDLDASDAAPRLQQVDESQPPLAVQEKAWVTGDNIADAQPGFDQQTQQPVLNFRFDKIGTEVFGRVTSRNVGRPFAIVLDDKVLSAPRILTPILGGSGQISGNFTTEQVRELATLLRAGSLPTGLKIVSVELVKGKG